MSVRGRRNGFTVVHHYAGGWGGHQIEAAGSGGTAMGHAVAEGAKAGGDALGEVARIGEDVAIGMAARAGMVGQVLRGLGPIGLGAAAAVGALWLAFDDARKAEDELTSVNQALARTGANATMTAQEVQALAERLAGSTLQSRDEVLKAETELMQFGTVLGDSFERTLQLAADLSVAFGGPLSSNVKLLGAALNEPSQALESLEKAGVRFTEAQRDLIQGLVESGRSFEAQQAILDAVAESVGGADAAAHGGLTGRIREMTSAWEAFVASFSRSDSVIGQAAAGIVGAITGILNAVREVTAASRDWQDGLQSSWAKYVSNATNSAAQVSRVFNDAMGGMEDVFVTFVTTGELNFDNLTQRIVEDLARIFWEREIVAPIGTALFGNGQSGGGGDSGGGGLFRELFSGDWFSGLFHEGGVAGEASTYREVPSWMFAGAPRFHDGGVAGLAPGEVPAVLKVGEVVGWPEQLRQAFGGAGTIQATDASASYVINVDARGPTRSPSISRPPLIILPRSPRSPPARCRSPTPPTPISACRFPISATVPTGWRSSFPPPAGRSPRRTCTWATCNWSPAPWRCRWRPGRWPPKPCWYRATSGPVPG